MKTVRIDRQKEIREDGQLIQVAGSPSSRPVGSVWTPSVASHGYRQVYINGKGKLLHRVMWEAFNGPIPEGMQIDHINGCKTDNRLENLRLVTKGQNLRSHWSNYGKSSKYRGVDWSKAANKWRSRIYSKGKQFNLGYFKTELEAAVMFDCHASQLGFNKEGLNFN